MAGAQGGPSNLQRFKSHHPLTFTGGGGGGGGSDGGRPLVPVDREDIEGHGDHLQCNQDQTSFILDRG